MTTTDPTALAGQHVLIPRAPGRGGGLARLVEAAGGVAAVAPLISRQAIDGAELTALDDAVAQLSDGAFAWVAVTSVNAVDELAASAQRVEADAAGSPAARASAKPEHQARSGEGDVDRSRDLSPLGRLGAVTRWAVVGPATARALAAHGISADLVAPQNSATGMLAVWPDAGPAVGPPAGAPATAPDAGPPAVGAPDVAPSPRAPSPPSPRVLLPLGDLARPTLEHGLTALGYTPVRVTAYRTVSHPAPPDVVARWRAGGFDAVVLTSGSVAREVADQLGARPDVLAVAIGEPTRDAARAVGQPIAAVADAATDAALFAALLAAASTATDAAGGTAAGTATKTTTPSPARLLDRADNAATIDPGLPPARTRALPHTPEES